MRISEEYRQYGKKPANVSINEGLLAAAKKLQINLSATFEKALEAEVRERRRENWLEDNREALEAYNAHVRENGLWNDDHRPF